MGKNSLSLHALIYTGTAGEMFLVNLLIVCIVAHVGSVSAKLPLLELSPQLSTLLGEKWLTRGDVMKKLWKYVKENNLIDPENKKEFTPNKKMEPVFGKAKMNIHGMGKYLKDHFIKPEITSNEGKPSSGQGK